MLICKRIFPHRAVHAGAKYNGFFGSQARIVLVTKLSAFPFAILAIVFASSGAINKESAHFRSSANSKHENIQFYLNDPSTYLYEGWDRLFSSTYSIRPDQHKQQSRPIPPD
jgi:hypothetical protein